MSGLVGLWHLDGRPLDARVLAGMSAALAHRGPDGEGRWLVGPVGFACQHQWVTPEEIGEHQPLVARSGVVVMLDGRLDNRDELLPQLGLPPTASDASCGLAAYEKWGEGFAERLNGDFAIAVFDAARQRLLLARDAIGVRPLYYFQSARLFAFASEIKALLAHPAIPCEPDDEGIADYLVVSSRPIDRQEVTCFKGIAALVAAHLAVVTPDGVMTRRYWDFDTTRAIRLKTFGDYVDAFREHFARAVERRLRSAWPVTVSVSGGLDSSSVFCQALELQRSGRARCPTIRGMSYFVADDPGADERIWVAAIERHWGVEVDQFSVDELAGVLSPWIAEQVSVVEAPFADCLWGVSGALHRRAARTGSRGLLSGLWGDQVLFSPAYLVDLVRAGLWRTIWQHRQAFVRWLGPEEARHRWRQFLLEIARQVLPRQLAVPLKGLRQRMFGVTRRTDWFARSFLRRALRFADQPAWPSGRFHSAYARAIYSQVRAKYHVHCLESANKAAAWHGLELAVPMLDRDLVAWLLAVPGDVQAWQGVPRRLLREAMRGVVPDTVRLRTTKGDWSRVVNRGVAGDLAAITQTVGPGSLGVALGYLDPDGLARAIDRLAVGLTRHDCLDSWDLGGVYALEAWLRAFSGPVQARWQSFGDAQAGASVRAGPDGLTGGSGRRRPSALHPASSKSAVDREAVSKAGTKPHEASPGGFHDAKSPWRSGTRQHHLIDDKIAGSQLSVVQTDGKAAVPDARAEGLR